jgi:hypothetical protein
MPGTFLLPFFHVSLSTPVGKAMGPLTGLSFLSHCCTEGRSRGGAVGIATGYELDGRGVGVRLLVEARFYSSNG